MKYIDTPRSSNIKRVGYDEATRELRLVFKGKDSEYSYSDVPFKVYESLIKAPSIGKFFASDIKSNPNYKFHKIVNN